MPGVAVVNQPSVTPRTDAGVEINFATEVTLEAARALLATIDADTGALASVDYATQTTLEATRVLLVSIDAKDFATQATLEAARVLLASLEAKDFATQTTLEAARVLLASLDGKDFATHTAQIDGSQKAIMRSGAKGTSTAADITSTPFDANTEAAHVDIIDSEASRQAAKLVVAAYHAEALAGSTDIVLIDLSDPGGDYKHVGTTGIRMTQVAGSIVKTTIGAQWKSKMGIILAIDGTAATIYWSDAATLFALDTSAVEQHKATVVPSAISFEVAAGALVYFAGGFIETGVTEFNTGATLPNVVGNATTPGVGDMVLRVTQVSGGGTAEVAYAVRYLVD